VKTARTRCEGMDLRIDDATDLDWIISQWEETWRGDSTREVVAAPDRRRFWNALLGAPKHAQRGSIHTVQLLDGARRVAGMVLFRIGETIMLQCSSRDPAYHTTGAGVRALDASIAWAAETGASTFYLGGAQGGYKEKWAPVTGVRYEAIF